MKLSGKVALVTGGAIGIGECCVDELLKNDIKGVVIADINSNVGDETSKKFNEKYGKGKTVFVKTNIADKNSFEDAFRKAIEVYGNIDILVNNAGVYDEVNWERLTQINLIGTTYGCLLAIDDYLPKYKSDSQTYIINVSSGAGLYPVGPSPHYTATKHAVVGLSKSLGINSVIAKKGICVMCLCPGATDTTIFNNPPVVYRELYETGIKTLKLQKPESVSKSVIEMLDKSENGSVWVVEDDAVHKLKLPTNHEYSYSKSF